MSSTYSTNLAIELIGTGDQAGTWGTTTNSNLGTLIEQSISGYVTQAVSTGTDTTITIPNGSSGVARNMYIELTGTGGASTNLIVPANKKLYFIFNNSSGAVTVKVSGQTGVSVPTGKKMVLVSNGTDIVNGLNYIADFASNSATITHLSATSATITNLTLTSLVISNLSIASANITTLTSASATISTTLALSGGTANGVAFLNGSKVVTSGTALAFDSSDRLIVGAGSAVFGSRIECVANSVGEGLRIRGRVSDGIGIVRFGANAAVTEFARIQSDNTSVLIFGTGASATERMRLDSSGNLGLGVTPSAWNTGGRAIEVGKLGNAVYSTAANTRYDTSNAFLNSSGDFKYAANGNATSYVQFNGTHAWNTAASGTAGNTVSFTQAMTLSAAGGLTVGGTTDPGAGKILAEGSSASHYVASSKAGVTSTYLITDANGANVQVDGSWPIRFTTNASERCRITSGGDFAVGTTSGDPVTGNVTGHVLYGVGAVQHSRDNDNVMFINRKSSDGNLVQFYQDGTIEGSISVSGNTVSYNAFAGSHWSQLQDGSKPDILRGTVMESINELCVWPDEQNERLPKSKVSDTAGSKKVYGVFMAWDNDWATTNDMYITAVGAFICRVNGSVTVQEGDLLESNGDGTARVQADDIIRSSTIGKVTSTVKTHQYADGSYCVPTVLYCG